MSLSGISKHHLVRDGLAVLLLAVMVHWYLTTYVNFNAPPFEDAAMLMRYAGHLAQGEGITWNPGERPVDGATDFLFMVLIALLSKTGLTLEAAAHWLGIISHLATTWLIYLATVRVPGNRSWMAFLTAAFFALGPGLRYTEAGFGTPFFALTACLTWLLACRLVHHGYTPGRAALFSLTGLVMGLARPEGVFLALFMLLAVLYRLGWKEGAPVAIWFAGTFALLGGCYFIWRWHYFGYPFPNPFYKKGGGVLHYDTLLASIQNVVRLGWPFLLPFLFSYRSRATLKNAVYVLIPVAGFTLLWILMSNETNYLMRFQYPVLPVILMAWPAVLPDPIPGLTPAGLKRQVLPLLLLVLVGTGLLYQQLSLYNVARPAVDGRAELGRSLSRYRNRGYTIATTEAGLLPYYSRWRAVDAWGLNDPWIAHHGSITEAYLNRYHPAVIMFHSFSSPLVPLPRYSTHPWTAMVRVLQNYAEKHGYYLAAAYGDSPYEAHYYYVRPDIPDFRAIVTLIRHRDYYWYATGKKAFNYAHRLQPVKENGL